MNPSVEDILEGEEELCYSDSEINLTGYLPGCSNRVFEQAMGDSPANFDRQPPSSCAAPLKPHLLDMEQRPRVSWGVYDTVFADQDVQAAARQQDFGDEPATMGTELLDIDQDPSPTFQPPSPPSIHLESTTATTTHDLQRLDQDIRAAIWALRKTDDNKPTTKIYGQHKRQRRNPARRRWLRDNNAFRYCTSLDHTINDCPNA